MKHATTFKLEHELIMLEGRAWGPRGDASVRLVLDTGSAMTLLVPATLDALGYSPRDGRAVTTVTSAIGKEQGYTLRLHQFEALGFSLAGLPIRVFDLADNYDIDGLVGLNFLQHFNCEIRFAERRLLVEST
jgi:predicted aspartyl protease